MAFSGRSHLKGTWHIGANDHGLSPYGQGKSPKHSAGPGVNQTTAFNSSPHIWRMCGARHGQDTDKPGVGIRYLSPASSFYLEDNPLIFPSLTLIGDPALGTPPRVETAWSNTPSISAGGTWNSKPLPSPIPSLASLAWMFSRAAE